MDMLAERILPGDIKNQLQALGKRPPFVRVSAGRPRWYFLRGRTILRTVLLLFFSIDVAFALICIFAVNIL
jgi:hypothetical protein